MLVPPLASSKILGILGQSSDQGSGVRRKGRSVDRPSCRGPENGRVSASMRTGGSRGAVFERVRKVERGDCVLYHA